ncbi:MAG: helix-turn-helix domain-containing protein [Firmicutes bacterium]|nr:helix-turn-helix domain-containing protein [Bacillota bacterium]
MLNINRLGERLREERERQGLTLEDICQRTHIRRRYLEALENGDYSIMPGEVYLKGFLRSYGEALGLNGWDLVAEYNKLRAQAEAEDKDVAGSQNKREEEDRQQGEPAQVRGTMIQNPIMLPAKERYLRNKTKQDRRLIFLSLLVLGAALVYFFLVPNGAQAPGPEQIIEVPETGGGTLKVTETAAGGGVESRAPQVEEATQVPAPVPAASEPVKKQVENVAEGEDTAKGVSLLEQTNKSQMPVAVGITAKEDCWLEIYQDGELTFTRVLKAGESKLVTAEQRIQIRFGNPDGVEVFHNGEVLTDLGSNVQTRVFTEYTNYTIQDLRRQEQPEQQPEQPEALSETEAVKEAGNTTDSQNLSEIDLENTEGELSWND